MVWLGMLFNISLSTLFAIIDFRSKIMSNIPILNVVAIWSTMYTDTISENLEAIGEKL